MNPKSADTLSMRNSELEDKEEAVEGLSVQQTDTAIADSGEATAVSPQEPFDPVVEGKRIRNWFNSLSLVERIMYTSFDIKVLLQTLTSVLQYEKDTKSLSLAGKWCCLG